jgi:nucleoside phosphorylase
MDLMEREGLLLRKEDLYIPSMTALRAAGTERARGAIRECNRILDLLKQKFRAKPSQLAWMPAELVAGTVLTEFDVKVFLTLIILQPGVQSFAHLLQFKDGFVSRLVLKDDSLLDTQPFEECEPPTPTVQLDAETPTADEFDYDLSAQPWFAKPPKTVEVAVGDLGELHGAVDVLIVVATEIEEDAVLALLAAPRRRRSVVKTHAGEATYHVGKLGHHHVAVTRCEMGSVSRSASLQSTARAIRFWRPRAAIMPGLAFGLYPEKQHVGDVLVSKTISPYGPRRRNADGTVTYRGSKPPSGVTLHDRFRSGRGWRFSRPDGVELQVRSGEVLSGEDLVDNLEFREGLKHDFPNAVGGEMEGTGLYAAADEAKTEWIIVKAICDWADGKKHSKYQPLAAAAAASFVAHVLGQKTVLDGLERPEPERDPRVTPKGKGRTKAGRLEVDSVRRDSPNSTFVSRSKSDERPKLRKPRVEAARLISERIALGEKLNNTYANRPTADREKWFRSVTRESSSWHEYNVELLDSLFSTDKVARSYRGIYMSVLGSSLDEDIEESQVRLADHISTLKRIVSQLDLYDEPASKAAGPVDSVGPSDSKNLTAFISYKWESDDHVAWVRQFATDLRINGIETILDQWEVRLGGSFTDYMQKHVNAANVILFVITPGAVKAAEAEEGKGGALKFEVQMANARRIKDGTRIIGIYRAGERPPNYLRDHRYADFRDDAKYGASLRELVDDLFGRRGPPPVKRPSFPAPPADGSGESGAPQAETYTRPGLESVLAALGGDRDQIVRAIERAQIFIRFTAAGRPKSLSVGEQVLQLLKEVSGLDATTAVARCRAKNRELFDTDSGDGDLRAQIRILIANALKGSSPPDPFDDQGAPPQRGPASGGPSAGADERKLVDLMERYVATLTQLEVSGKYQSAPPHSHVCSELGLDPRGPNGTGYKIMCRLIEAKRIRQEGLQVTRNPNTALSFTDWPVRVCG